MSEMFLADAAVRVRADTALFRTQLLAGVTAAVKQAEAIAKIRVGAVGAAAIGAGTAAGISSLTTNASAATSSVNKLVGATATLGATQNKEAVAANLAAGANERLAQSERRSSSLLGSSITRRNEAIKGLQAQALSMVGLRGAIIGANPAFLAATASAILFGSAVKQAASFETELNVFRVTAGATADEMARVGETARQLGADVSLPAVSTADAAQAMTELAKAGLSVQDSIGGARGVLQLATAAQIDNAAATELAASALNAFGLAGSDAVHVADVLANAANDAQGSISDIGVALQQAAAVGRQAGLSLEQVTAVLTLFARNGLRGSDAGTSFRTMMIRLINPTEKAQQIIDKLGLSLRDATGAINLNVFQQFADATKNVTKAERDRDLAIIFGQDAIRGAAIAAREGTAALDAQIDSLNKAGTAAEVAGARVQGLAGSAENLKNQLATAGLALGQSLAPAIKNIVDVAAEAVGGIKTLSDRVTQLRKESQKPIDIVVNVVGGDGDGGGGITGRLGDFARNLLTGSLPAQAGAATQSFRDFRESVILTQAALEDLTGVDLVTFPTVKQARKEVAGLVDEVNKFQDPPALHALITRLLEMQKEMQGGTVETKAFADELQSFIDNLQKIAGQGKITIPIELPANLTGGRAGTDAGRSVIEGLQKELSEANLFGITTSFFDKLAVASTTSSARFVHSGELTAKQFTTAMQQGLTQGFLAVLASVKQGSQALVDEMNRVLIAGGGPAQQIAVLRKQFADAQRTIDAANKRLETLPAGPSKARARAKKERSAALAEQAAITAQIKSQTDAIATAAEQAAAGRKSRAAEIERARNEADQAFLKSLEPRRAILDRLMAVAEGTEGEADNRRILIALKKLAFAEIKLIDEHVKDKRLAAQLIEARRNEIVNLDNRIAAANKAIADSAKETARKRADAFSELLGKRITLAGLREDRGAELAAINRAIANARKRVRDYKKLGTLQIDEKIALEELINRRDDLLNTAKDGTKQGTTAFDLLKQFADTFRDVGGNLINANQPFPGPTGFTADIAQFLVRRPGAQTTGPTATTAAAKTPIELNDDRLVRSMDRLADVIERSSGNRTTGSSAADVVGQRWTAAGAFWEARMARNAVGANNG